MTITSKKHYLLTIVSIICLIVGCHKSFAQKNDSIIYFNSHITLIPIIINYGDTAKLKIKSGKFDYTNSHTGLGVSPNVKISASTSSRPALKIRPATFTDETTDTTIKYFDTTTVDTIDDIALSKVYFLYFGTNYIVDSNGKSMSIKDYIIKKFLPDSVIYVSPTPIKEISLISVAGAATLDWNKQWHIKDPEKAIEILLLNCLTLMKEKEELEKQNEELNKKLYKY